MSVSQCFVHVHVDIGVIARSEFDSSWASSGAHDLHGGKLCCRYVRSIRPTEGWLLGAVVSSYYWAEVCTGPRLTLCREKLSAASPQNTE